MSYFDIIILIILGLSFIKGFHSGLVMQLAMLSGLIACSIFAGLIASKIAPYILKLEKINPHILSPLSYILAFLLIMFIFILIGRALQSILKAAFLSPINKLAGGFFCAIKWLIIISITLNIVMEFDAHKNLITQDSRNKSIFLNHIGKIAPSFIPFLKF